MKQTIVRVWVIAALCGLGCGTGAARGSADATGTPEAVDRTDAAGCGTGWSVRIVPVDAWGRRLANPDLLVRRDGAPVGSPGAEDLVVPVDSSAVLDVSVSAPGFEPAAVAITVDPTRADPLRVQRKSGNAAVAWSRTGTPESGSPGCERWTIYVGLDHLWFASSGRPARSETQLDLLMDGESFWKAVHDDVMAARDRIGMSTWWWQSDFEWVRPAGHEDMDAAQRTQNTALYLLDHVPAFKRLLVNRFAPESSSGLAYLNTDPEIRARGLAEGDGFEVMLQGNSTQVPLQGVYEGPTPTWSLAERLRANPEFAQEVWPSEGVRRSGLTAFDAASYHQKAFVMDGRVAYVSGMNVKSTDWDTSEHRVFESRRMKFASFREERIAVRDKRRLPDVGPRKDYGIRLEGPAALDVEDVLRVRWAQAIREGAMFFEHATPWERPETTGSAVWAPLQGSPLCQVTATLPPPIEEQSILETWTKALRNATSFIYIEDQYWRMPILNALILKTMQDRPWVTLIVVTKPVAITDGAKKWTVESDRLFRENVGDRYLLLQLKSFDAVARTDPRPDDPETASYYFIEMDTHSKMLIVDDEYLSVGSCNKNNRGLLYEGELNVSVWDPTFVRDARRRIYRNLVGPDRASEVTDDAAQNFALLRSIAIENAATEAWWETHAPGLDAQGVAGAANQHRPDGFVYPLEFTPDYLLEVGPNVF